MNCPKCDKETKHKHVHDTAHGIPETHMVGTECYVCGECGYRMRKAEAEKQGLKFFLE